MLAKYRLISLFMCLTYFSGYYENQRKNEKNVYKYLPITPEEAGEKIKELWQKKQVTGF